MLRSFSNKLLLVLNKPFYDFNLTRGFKSRGDYFRNIGYEYNKIYKGGEFEVKILSD